MNLTMNNELTKNELAKNKLTKEDISNLFQSLQYGVSISSFWSDESIIAFNQADWDKAFINQRFLEQVLNDSSHPLHNSPDLYCLYQLLLCYEKKSRKVLWLDTILILLIS